MGDHCPTDRCLSCFNFIDEEGNCPCGRIKDGVDTQQIRIIPDGKNNDHFGNRCSKDGTFFDEGGICARGHEKSS